MAYFFEKAPSVSRKTGAARLLPARKPWIAAASSWKLTVATRALPPQRCASGFTRSTMSRECGDQEAQRTRIEAPCESSDSANCSPFNPCRRIQWEEAGADAVES